MEPFEKLSNFFKRFKKLRFKKGEVIFQPGITPPGVFYLEKGYVRLYSISYDGKDLTLVIYKPYDFFPMLWTLTDRPIEYYTESITPTEVYRADKKEFIKFLKENPDVLYELTKRVLVRFGGLLIRMEHLIFGKAYEKVASILVVCAERFGKKEGKKIMIQVPLTHKDIANLIGITRETVSIEMKKLEKKGLISSHGKIIVIKNIKKLEEDSLVEKL